MEEWRTVEDAPKYEVSNTGKVRNIRSGREVYPRLRKNTLVVSLWFEEFHQARSRSLPRLVMTTFREDKGRSFLVQHLDDDWENCSLENLYWVPIGEVFRTNWNERHGLKNPGDVVWDSADDEWVEAFMQKHLKRENENGRIRVTGGSPG